MAAVLPVSAQVVPSLQINDIVKTFAVTVPVESVPMVLKLVPQVSVKAVVPEVVI